MIEITFAGKRDEDNIYVTGIITNGPTISFAITDEDLANFNAYLQNPTDLRNYLVDGIERSYYFAIDSHNGICTIEIDSNVGDNPNSCNFVYEKRITNAAMLEALNDMIIV